jgi:hypothetical protein
MNLRSRRSMSSGRMVVRAPSSAWSLDRGRITSDTRRRGSRCVPLPYTLSFRPQPEPYPLPPPQVKRERATNMLDLNSGTPWETVHLTTLSRDRSLFSSLLSEARALAMQAQVGRTVIYTAWGAEWRPFGRPREKRLLESVVLDEGVKERVVEDVKSFMSRGRWYSERGALSPSPLRARCTDTPLSQVFPTDEATSSTVLPALANPPSFKLSPVLSTTTSAFSTFPNED